MSDGQGGSFLSCLPCFLGTSKNLGRDQASNSSSTSRDSTQDARCENVNPCQAQTSPSSKAWHESSSSQREQQPQHSQQPRQQQQQRLLPVLAPKPIPSSSEHVLPQASQTGWLASWLPPKETQPGGQGLPATAAAAGVRPNSDSKRSSEGSGLQAPPAFPANAAQLILRVWNVSQLAHLHPRVLELMLPSLVSLAHNPSATQQQGTSASTAVARFWGQQAAKDAAQKSRRRDSVRFSNDRPPSLHLQHTELEAPLFLQPMAASPATLELCGCPPFPADCAAMLTSHLEYVPPPNANQPHLPTGASHQPPRSPSPGCPPSLGTLQPHCLAGVLLHLASRMPHCNSVNSTPLVYDSVNKAAGLQPVVSSGPNHAVEKPAPSSTSAAADAACGPVSADSGAGADSAAVPGTRALAWCGRDLMAAVHMAFFTVPESGSLEPVLVLEHSAVTPQQQQQQQQQQQELQQPFPHVAGCSRQQAPSLPGAADGGNASGYLSTTAHRRTLSHLSSEDRRFHSTSPAPHADSSMSKAVPQSPCTSPSPSKIQHHLLPHQHPAHQSSATATPAVPPFLQQHAQQHEPHQLHGNIRDALVRLLQGDVMETAPHHPPPTRSTTRDKAPSMQQDPPHSPFSPSGRRTTGGSALGLPHPAHVSTIIHNTNHTHHNHHSTAPSSSTSLGPPLHPDSKSQFWTATSRRRSLGARPGPSLPHGKPISRAPSLTQLNAQAPPTSASNISDASCSSSTPGSKRVKCMASFRLGDKSAGTAPPSPSIGHFLTLERKGSDQQHHFFSSFADMCDATAAEASLLRPPTPPIEGDASQGFSNLKPKPPAFPSTHSRRKSHDSQNDRSSPAISTKGPMAGFVRAMAILNEVPVIATLVEMGGRVVFQNKASHHYWGMLETPLHQSARTSVCSHPSTGGTNLNALLDTLLPNDSAGVQELLDETSAGNVWQRVLPMPAPLGHLERFNSRHSRRTSSIRSSMFSVGSSRMSATCLVDSHGGIIGLEGVREEDSFESESRWLPAYGEEKGAIKQQQQDKDHHHQQQQQQPPRKAQRQASLDRQAKKELPKPPHPTPESSHKLFKLTSNIIDQAAADEALEGRPSLTRSSRQQQQQQQKPPLPSPGSSQRLLKLTTNIIDQAAADEALEGRPSLTRSSRQQQQQQKPPLPSPGSSQRLLKLSSNVTDQTAADEALEGSSCQSRTSRQQQQQPRRQNSVGVAEMVATVRPPWGSAQSKAVEAEKEAKNTGSQQGNSPPRSNQSEAVKAETEAKEETEAKDTSSQQVIPPPVTNQSQAVAVKEAGTTSLQQGSSPPDACGLAPSASPASQSLASRSFIRSVSFAKNVVDKPSHRRASALELRRKSLGGHREQATPFSRHSVIAGGGSEDATVLGGRMRRSSSLAQSLEQLLGEGGGPAGDTKQQRQQQQQRRFTDGGAAAAQRMSGGPQGGCGEGVTAPSGSSARRRPPKASWSSRSLADRVSGSASSVDRPSSSNVGEISFGTPAGTSAATTGTASTWGSHAAPSLRGLSRSSRALRNFTEGLVFEEEVDFEAEAEETPSANEASPPKLSIRVDSPSHKGSPAKSSPSQKGSPAKQEGPTVFAKTQKGSVFAAQADTTSPVNISGSNSASNTPLPWGRIGLAVEPSSRVMSLLQGASPVERGNELSNGRFQRSSKVWDKTEDSPDRSLHGPNRQAHKLAARARSESINDLKMHLSNVLRTSSAHSPGELPRVPPMDEFMLLQPPRSAIGLARNSSIAGALASSPLEEPQGVTVGAPCLGRRSLEAEHASKNRALPKPTPHPALLKRGWKEPSCSRMKARRDSKAQAEEQQQQQQQQQPQETEQGPQPQQQQFAEEQRASEVRASLHRMGLLKQHLQQHAAAEGASLPPSSAPWKASSNLGPARADTGLHPGDQLAQGQKAGRPTIPVRSASNPEGISSGESRAPPRPSLVSRDSLPPDMDFLLREGGRGNSPPPAAGESSQKPSQQSNGDRKQRHASEPLSHQQHQQQRHQQQQHHHHHHQPNLQQRRASFPMPGTFQMAGQASKPDSAEELYDTEEGAEATVSMENSIASLMPFWHEVQAMSITDPVSGRAALLLLQTDITSRAELETRMAALTESQLAMLEQMFPRHVLEYMVAKQHSHNSPDLPVRLPSPSQAPNANQLASSHENVTILFTDIVGFTAMSKEVKPDQVMAYLNELFTAFDALVDTYEIYKVETAGDCYIAAGGLTLIDEDGFTCIDPTPDPQEAAQRVLSFAKALLYCAKKVVMPHNGEPTQIRVGIHTGPAVTGLIGTKLPKYSVFGDTMNTASRMESTCPYGCIQISQATHTLLPNHPFTPTGGVEVKGKGRMLTFLWSPEVDHPGEDLAASAQATEETIHAST